MGHTNNGAGGRWGPRQLVDWLVGKLLGRVVERVVDGALDRDARDIARARRRRARDESAAFVAEHLAGVAAVEDRDRLQELCVAAMPASGLVVELGVWQGRSLNHIAARCPERPVFGFDSFEGLPEDWRDGYLQGSFAVSRPPEVRDNVTLVRGWFADTLPEFLQQHSGVVALMHVDCDLYSSARTVFSLFRERFVDGSVILLDDFFNYPGWAQGGEFKAFGELLRELSATPEYLGYCQTGTAVGARLRFG